MVSYSNSRLTGRPLIVMNAKETDEAKSAEHELSLYLQQSAAASAQRKSYPSYGNDLVSPRHW